MGEPSLETRSVSAVRPPLGILTTLRFFAAVEVVVFHVGASSLASGFLGNLFSAGYEAVTFFFVLSGFILTYAYYDDTKPRSLRTCAWNFWSFRAARIVPTYMLALVIALPQFVYSAAVAHILPMNAFVVGLALVPTFLQAWYPPAAFLWNGPAWSLSVEAAFYVAFPAILAASGRVSPLRFLVGAYVLVLLMLVLRRTLDLGAVEMWEPSSKRNFEAYFPLFHFPQFVFGMALGRCYLAGSRKPSKRYDVVFLVGGLCLGAIFGFQSHLPPWAHWARTDAVLVLLFGVVIYAGALSVYSARILSNKPLVILGEASDAIYILHGPILFWERWFLVKVVGWEWLPNWNVASSVVIVTIASVLVYYLFERPVRRRIAHYLLAARMSSSG